MKEALVLLPISYLVRIANYQVSWKLVLDKDQFLMTDAWGDTVPVTEQEDLTFLSKATFWRVGHDLFHFANKVDGMEWKEVWQALTGEAVQIQSISVKRDDSIPVDFVELFNPGNFTACAQDLQPGTIYDVRVDPEKGMRVETYRIQARHDIARADPLIVLAAPPCTVFSSMQNINQKHHGTPEWEKKYEDGLTLLQLSVDVCWDQISRGKFFLHEHPATASSWDVSGSNGYGAFGVGGGWAALLIPYSFEPALVPSPGGHLTATEVCLSCGQRRGLPFLPGVRWDLGSREIVFSGKQLEFRRLSSGWSGRRVHVCAVCQAQFSSCMPTSKSFGTYLLQRKVA